MGLFDIFRKMKKFEKVSSQETFTLENQDGVKNVDNEFDIYRYFDIMTEDATQHIILTSPVALYGIRYIQAIQSNGMIEVEIGIETESGTYLYFKECSEEEARRSFIDFYHKTFDPDKKQYKPLQF